MQNKELKFLISAFALENTYTSLEYALEWIRKQNDLVKVDVQKTTFSKLPLWGYSPDKYNFKHDTGRFFSIDGIQVRTNIGLVKEWTQPIINQPEIGFLGFITKEINGILHFLMQAKIEPGNVNNVQLSPTLQATKSNYTRAHKGKSPAYLDYFLNVKPDDVLLDQLQSEQGARFLRKRNRNIIIHVNEEVELLENFIWLSLAQIKLLMAHNNVVNMDTRTVVSGISFGTFSENEIDVFNYLNEGGRDKSSLQKLFLKSTLLGQKSFHDFDHILNFVTHKKANYELSVQQIPLSSLEDWVLDEDSIHHVDNKYFRVIPVQVSISNREVVNWSQPMVEPMQEGICAFVCREIDGILHFAVQTKLECGNFDTIEFAPTVQCLTGNFKESGQQIPFLDFVLNATKDSIVYDTFQSEEGGRFYREQNRNMIVLADSTLPVELPENYIWMTINQLQLFIRFNNYINIQARSLLAAIPLKV